MPVVSRLSAALIALAAAPAANAAVTLVDRPTGTYTETIAYADYSPCDHNEEYCATLPYGGGYQNGNWRLTLDNDRVDFAFRLSQVNDIARPLQFQIVEVGRFLADAPVRIYSRQSASVRRFGPLACSGCDFQSDLSYSVEDLGDGRSRILFSIFTDAQLGSGGQQSDSRFVLKIATVPEPRTWAMLIIGFGLVGIAARRAPVTTT